MKAAYIERVGPADQIRYGEFPEPAVGPSDALVRVEAVAVNPVDTYIRSGKVPIELPLPFIIGRDVVGTVERVGAEVRRCAPATASGQIGKVLAAGRERLPSAWRSTSTGSIPSPRAPTQSSWSPRCKRA